MATPLARLDGVQASLHERAQAKREAEKVYPAHASLARLLMRRVYSAGGQWVRKAVRWRLSSKYKFR